MNRIESNHNKHVCFAMIGHERESLFYEALFHFRQLSVEDQGTSIFQYIYNLRSQIPEVKIAFFLPFLLFCFLLCCCLLLLLFDPSIIQFVLLVVLLCVCFA